GRQRAAPAGRYDGRRNQHSLPDGRHAAGGRRARAHAHAATAGRASPAAYPRRRPPGLRDCAAQSHRRSPVEPEGARAQQGAQEAALPRAAGITRAVLRQAEGVLARRRKSEGQLRATNDLLRRVVAQTQARVLRGNTRFPGKVVSLFEPHTEIIRKGKLAKPTEFGRLVKIQEAEAQFITDYAVCERGQAERALWAPALDRHIALFHHAPQLVGADGGFASRSNERAAADRGVRHVVLPRQPRERRSRAARAALRWRTGCEGRISALKRRHGLRRCRYRGPSGMQRWVGLGVLANDLLVL